MLRFGLGFGLGFGLLTLTRVFTCWLKVEA
jgi:hypothetical protein